jgi:hypothetical protein
MSALAWAPVAEASCTNHYYILNGRTIACYACCLQGGSCTTTCTG